MNNAYCFFVEHDESGKFFVYLKTEGKKPFMLCSTEGHIVDGEMIAMRIQACLTACKGVSTHALTAGYLGSLQGLVEDMDAYLRKPSIETRQRLSWKIRSARRQSKASCSDCRNHNHSDGK